MAKRNCELNSRFWANFEKAVPDCLETTKVGSMAIWTGSWAQVTET